MTSSPTRRQFIARSTATAVLAGVGSRVQAQTSASGGPFTLPPLPYAPAALEPHIDAKTMEIHHGKHHQAYVTGLNTALKGEEALQKKTLEELVGGIPFLPEAVQTPVRNHGGGHWNHSFFWNSLAPAGSPGTGEGPEDGAFTNALVKAFGSVDDFKKKFNEAATKRFGSGWAWLIVKEDGSLGVVSTPNQDNPLMQGIVPNSDRGTPLLGLDVWEHAYYLHYQNRRPDYIAAWWKVVNWKETAARFAAATTPEATGKKKK